MRVISFDNGSSFTKVFAGELAKLKIPTLEVRLDKVSTAIEQDVIFVEGLPYLVGEDARNSQLVGESDPKVDGKFHGGATQYVHMCYLLDRIKAFEYSPEILICSLPYSDTQDKSLVEKLKQRKTFEWEVLVDGKREKRTVIFREVMVVPQGVGALASTDLIHNKDFPIIAIADIGSCTMDVPVLGWHREKKQHVYNASASFSTRTFNTNWAISRIRDALKSLPGCGEKTFSYHQISNMLEDDHFTFVHKSEKFDDATVRPLISRVKREFTHEMVKEMERNIGAELWSNITRLALAGGGASLVERRDWDCIERTEFLNEWSTVIGQFRSFS